MDTQVRLEKQIDALDNEISETRELLQDPSYAELAKVEIARLEEEKAVIERTLETLSDLNINPLPNDPAQPPKLGKPKVLSNRIILEIRPAAGGNEAGLFAAELYRMYKKFAQSQNWKIKELSKSTGGLGNIKEVSIQISVPQQQQETSDVYRLLKNEAGTHRVQRVPATEKSGRIHTSTVTVAVLPVVSAVEININPNDLKVEAFRSSGPGGQHMQKTESAVRITHLPTGITASSQQARHQRANRDQALDILRARLFQEMQSQQKRSLDEIRSAAVGRGERSEKIRTYNFPANRVTDHRIKKSWHNLAEILGGNLMPILAALQQKKG